MGWVWVKNLALIKKLIKSEGIKRKKDMWRREEINEIENGKEGTRDHWGEKYHRQYKR